MLKNYIFIFRNSRWNFKNHFLSWSKLKKKVQVSCYVSFRKWQRFLILDMINWQCFLNLAMEIGQRFQIVSLETGQCFQIVSLEQGNVMIESIALFPRTRFGSVALFPWPNLGSVASLSCPKLGNIATFWRKCSTRLEPFYEFFTHLEHEFLSSEKRSFWDYVFIIPSELPSFLPNYSSFLPNHSSIFPSEFLIFPSESASSLPNHRDT